jgi:hypothetical protein
MRSCTAPAIVLSVLSVLLSAASARADDASARSGPMLRQAESLAKKREIDAAADLYRKLLEGDIDGVGIRYNLGTLCLEQGDVACSVSQLLAARRRAPLDDDVRHNLDVAIEARVDRLAGSQATDPVRALGEKTPPLMARLAFALPLAFLGLLLGALGFVDGSLRAALRTFALVIAGATALGVVVYACRLSVERTREVVVLRETPALKEPDADAAVSFTAHAGLSADVVGEDGALLRVRFENGLEAWMRQTDVAFVE